MAIRRKLVQQGSSTLMVSLPSTWVKSLSLAKGSEVNIDYLNNDILISAKKADYKAETGIKLISDKETSIRALITNAYRQGFDRIRVSFDNEEQFRILDSIIKSRLIGLEIVSKGKDHCVVENVTEPAGDQFDNILRKYFLSIDELFEVTRQRFNGESPAENYESIQERIQKYDNFCRRVISKEKFMNKKAEVLWTFLALILHGQREIYHMNKVIGKIKKVSVETKKLLLQCKEIFELIKKSYLDKNIDLLAEVHEKEIQIIYKDGYKLLSENRGEETILIHHLLHAARVFYQSNSPLSGLILE